jgi:hypothetical protein
VASAPGEKATPKRDLSPGDRRDLGRSIEERGKGVAEEKKTVVAKVEEGQSKAEASKSLPGEPPSEPVLAKKEEPIEGRREVAKTAGSSEPRVGTQLLPSPMPPKRREESKESKYAETEKMPEHRLPPAAGFRPGILAVRKEKAGLVSVTIHVVDVEMASEKIENLLGQLGGQRIKRESLQTKEVISAGLHAEKIKDFFDRLAAIGEVKEKGVPSDIPKGNTAIRIEIVRNP